MPRGGARFRSGPAPDPMSFRTLRRQERGDLAVAGWVVLPGPFVGPVERFPLSRATDAERELWEELWHKPQAHEWSRCGLQLQVAAYVRWFLESVGPGAGPSLHTLVMRAGAALGLSISGLARNQWILK